jgi:hypothetical protein
MLMHLKHHYGRESDYPESDPITYHILARLSFTYHQTYSITNNSIAYNSIAYKSVTHQIAYEIAYD